MFKFDTLVNKGRTLCMDHSECGCTQETNTNTNINENKKTKLSAIPKIKNRYEHSNRYNHIAYLIKGKKVINYSRNNYHRQYVNGQATTSMHAEVGCLLKYKDCDKIKKGFSLLILRFSKNEGLLCDSRPCNNCKTFLLKKGITKVYCSTADGTIQKFKLDDIEEYYSVAWLKFKGMKEGMKDGTKEEVVREGMREGMREEYTCK